MTGKPTKGLRTWNITFRFGKPNQETGLPDLIAGVRAGSVAHFGELYRRYHPTLIDYLRPIAGDDAEDLAQETFVRLPDKLERYQEQGTFEPWLKGVAFNLARTGRRSSNRRHEETLEEERLPAMDLNKTGAYTREDFWGHAIKSMSPPLQEVWLLHKQGFEARDIATRLGITANAAATRVSRARSYLEAEVRRLIDE